MIRVLLLALILGVLLFAQTTEGPDAECSRGSKCECQGMDKPDSVCKTYCKPQNCCCKKRDASQTRSAATRN